MSGLLLAPLTIQTFEHEDESKYESGLGGNFSIKLLQFQINYMFLDLDITQTYQNRS